MREVMIKTNVDKCPICKKDNLSEEPYLDEIESLYYDATLTICNDCGFMYDADLLCEEIR